MKKTTWANVNQLDKAYSLCNQGSFLSIKNLYRLKKIFTEKQLLLILDQMIFSFESNPQLKNKILLKNILLLSTNKKTIFFNRVIEKIIENQNKKKLLDNFIESAIGNSLDSKSNIISLAIFSDIVTKSDKELLIEASNKLTWISFITKIESYFISISNTKNQITQTIILNHFLTQSHIKERRVNHAYYDKILDRFGFTISTTLLENFFTQKNKFKYFRYLSEIFSCLLERNDNSQKIVTDVFKHFILINPTKLVYFLELFHRHIFIPSNNRNLKKNYVNQLYDLLIASSASHQHKYYNKILYLLYTQEEISKENILSSLLKDKKTNDILKNKLKLIRSYCIQNKQNRIIKLIKESIKGRKTNLIPYEKALTTNQLLALKGTRERL